MTILNIDGTVNTPVPVAWAVGPDGEAGWLHIKAATEDEAIAAYAEGDLDLIEGGDLVAVRVEAWDHVTRYPTAREWLEAGLGYSCQCCGEIASLDSGAEIVDDSTVQCRECCVQQKPDEAES